MLRVAVGGDDVHVDLVVEAQGPHVSHVRLEDGDVGALLAQRRVRMTDRPHVLDARRLEVGEVGGVVHDPHRVGLGEAHAQRGG